MFDGGSSTVVDSLTTDVYNVSRGASLTIKALKDTNVFNLSGSRSEYEISARGNVVTISDAAGGKVVLRANNNEQSIVFQDGTLTLQSQGGIISLGSQVITKSLAPITVAPDVSRTSAAIFNVASSGVVVNGYHQGSTVFADANGNGRLDPGEVSTTTDSNGRYTLLGGKGNLVVFGGLDISTNTPLLGTLKAPLGSGVISHLTNLVVSLTQAGVVRNEAVRQVKDAFGIEGDVDIFTFDPIAAVINSNTAPDTATNALKIAAASAQLSVLTSMSNSAVSGLAGLAAGIRVGNSIIDSVADLIRMSSGQALDLGSASVVQSALQSSVASSLRDNPTALETLQPQITDIAAILADNVVNIQRTASTDTGIEYLRKVAQATTASNDGAAQILAAAVTGSNTASVKESITGAALRQITNQSRAGVISREIEQNRENNDNSGGGNSTPTFTVADSGSGAYVVGDQNGTVTVTIVGSDYVFTPATGAAVTLPIASVNSLVVNGITLTATAATLNGKTVTGTGTVNVTGLDATASADLSAIAATSVTANAAGNVTFTGNLGKAAVTVASGVMNVDGATMGTSSFSVSSGATLSGTAAKLSGVTVAGAGTVNVTGLDATASADLSAIAATSVTANAAGNVTFTGNLGKAAVTVASGVMNVDGATMGTSSFSVSSGATLSGTAAKLSGVTVAGAGTVNVTGLAADTNLSTITPTTLNATITSGISIAGIDVSNIDSLELGATGITATSSQITALSGKTTIVGGGAALTQDLTAPTASVTAATILSSGNAVVQSTEVGTAYLVNTSVVVTNKASITGAADNNVNSVSITQANVDTNIAATGLVDGTYKVYVVDAADNLSAASSGTVTIDATAPTASVTTASIRPEGNAVVRSTELGTAYLVKSTVTVTSEASITGANDNEFNSVAITAANTDTNLAATGLVDGTYKVYAVDSADLSDFLCSRRG